MIDVVRVFMKKRLLNEHTSMTIDRTISDSIFGYIFFLGNAHKLHRVKLGGAISRFSYHFEDVSNEKKKRERL